MCQHKNKSMKATSVKCYRVYNNKKSFYNGYPLPKVGVPTDCENGKIDPFHAFRSKEAVELWTNADGYVSGQIYECRLSGSLKSGVWDTKSVNTCTGTTLTILRKAGSIRRSKVTWL